MASVFLSRALSENQKIALGNLCEAVRLYHNLVSQIEGPANTDTGKVDRSQMICNRAQFPPVLLQALSSAVSYAEQVGPEGIVYLEGQTAYSLGTRHRHLLGTKI